MSPILFTSMKNDLAFILTTQIDVASKHLDSNKYLFYKLIKQELTKKVRHNVYQVC